VVPSNFKHQQVLYSIAAWRDGKYYTAFIRNLAVFPAVKEFWKSVKISRSYRYEYGRSH